MARFKITFGERRPKEVKGVGIPSPEWVAANKHKKFYQNAVSNAWGLYLANLGVELEVFYLKTASDRTDNTNDVYARYAKGNNEYMRAKKIPGYATGHRVKIKETNTNGVLSGELLDIIRKPLLVFDKIGDYRILTPVFDTDFKALSIAHTGKSRSYHLSKFLQNEFGFGEFNKLPSGFGRGEGAYVFAENKMNKSLKALESMGKGKQSKRKR